MEGLVGASGVYTRVATASRFHDLPDRALTANGFTLRDGALRLPEAAALMGADVRRWLDGAGQLAIVKSKTNRSGESEVVAVTPACLRALNAFRPERAFPEGRVFQISLRQIANQIKAACHAAGLEGGSFSGHSGRVGVARMMSDARAPTETTIRQGRWKSAEMVRRHTRATSAS